MKIALILVLATFLYGDFKQDIFKLYQDKKYSKVCNLGYKNFTKLKNDEKFISLYAFACLKSDYIDMLSVPITKLKQSKESRANASYFSIILMQKKLLYYAMVDGYDISSLNLPSTDYVLSKAFDFYIKQNRKKDIYIFNDDKNNRISYKLSLTKKRGIYKIVIDEFYDNKFVKKHIYW